MLCGIASAFANNVRAVALLLPAVLATCRSIGGVPFGYRFPDHARIGVARNALVLIVGTALIAIFRS